MLIKIESIRCPDVTGLVSGCLRNCRPDTPEYALVIVKGSVPKTLPQVDIRKVAYLHIDMNCVLPEVEALKFFGQN